MVEPQLPPSLSRAAVATYALALPAGLLGLIFVPAGSWRWMPGWIFLAVLVTAYAVSAAVLAYINPVIYRARSGFHPGTMGWDKRILAVMLPLMVSILPVAALDAGRFHWTRVPLWLTLAGYAAMIGGIALTAWAQSVNPYFEPGVRIQRERGQHVIDTGPYRIVRHPGYSAAIMLFFGMALALRSIVALAPATFAALMLIVRTRWEDRLLMAELPGYQSYSRQVSARLIPTIW